MSEKRLSLTPNGNVRYQLQNINWAIKGEYLRVLMPTLKEGIGQHLTKKQVIDHAKNAVCYITTRE